MDLKQLGFNCRALVVVGSPSTLQHDRRTRWCDWLNWVSHYQAHVDDSVLPACPFEPDMQPGTDIGGSLQPVQQHLPQENGGQTSSAPGKGSQAESENDTPVNLQLEGQPLPAKLSATAPAGAATKRTRKRTL